MKLLWWFYDPFVCFELKWKFDQVIIGSHWDTVDTTDGYNDNGSGVATLLELARLIVESKCRPKNSIVFVAFDLEEMGAQGSQEFVNRFWSKYFEVIYM